MSPHAFSTVCQKTAVPFVRAVNNILNPDSVAAKDAYDKTTPLQCPLKKRPNKGTSEGGAQNRAQADPEKEKELREAIEDEMLCAVMCCCDRHPAKSLKAKLEESPNPSQTKSNEKNYHQTCVKDVFDRVNGIRDDNYKPYRHLPYSPQAAELSINEGWDYRKKKFILKCYVARSAMNDDKNLTKQNGQRLVRPDMAMLNKYVKNNGSVLPNERILLDKNIERFVEMKFPTEDGDMVETIDQLLEYWEFGRPVHLMQRCENNNFKESFQNILRKKFLKHQKYVLRLIKKFEKTKAAKFYTEEIDEKKKSIESFLAAVKKEKKPTSKDKFIDDYMNIKLKCCDCLRGKHPNTRTSKVNRKESEIASGSCGNIAVTIEQPEKDVQKIISVAEKKISAIKMIFNEAKQKTKTLKQISKKTKPGTTISESKAKKIYLQLKKNEKEIIEKLDEGLDAISEVQAALEQAQKRIKEELKNMRHKKQDPAALNKVKENLSKELVNLTEKLNSVKELNKTAAAFRFKASLAIADFLSRSKYIPKV